MWNCRTILLRLSTFFIVCFFIPWTTWLMRLLTLNYYYIKSLNSQSLCTIFPALSAIKKCHSQIFPCLYGSIMPSLFMFEHVISYNPYNYNSIINTLCRMSCSEYLCSETRGCSSSFITKVCSQMATEECLYAAVFCFSYFTVLHPGFLNTSKIFKAKEE